MTDQDFYLPYAMRRLAEALEILNTEDLRRICDPLCTVEIKVTRKRIKDEKSAGIPEADVDDVISRLIGFQNRKDAQDLLDGNFKSKRALEVIARRLDIPISKQTKFEELRDKIVEATVGAKMRSQVIQGTN